METCRRFESLVILRTLYEKQETPLDQSFDTQNYMENSSVARSDLTLHEVRAGAQLLRKAGNGGATRSAPNSVPSRPCDGGVRCWDRFILSERSRSGAHVWRNRDTVAPRHADSRPHGPENRRFPLNRLDEQA